MEFWGEEISRPNPRRHPTTGGGHSLPVTLPDRIDDLEVERDQLHQTLSDPSVYKSGGDIPTMKTRLEAIDVELETAFARWEILDNLRS